MKYYIGIDLGGTNIVAGVVDEQFRLLAKANDKTRVGRPAKEIAQTMAQTAREAAKAAGIGMEQVESVGIGSPGIVDSEKKEVLFASNLYFENVPIGQMVEDELGLPVFIANDADAAAYGEFMAGAGRMEDGRHISNMLAITLGTGVGSGIIINSKIYNGYGFAGGELGHTVLRLNGRQCTCGRKGCVDIYCSATGLIMTTKEHMEKHPESLMWKLCGGDLDKVDGRTCFDAAAQGDQAGKDAADEYTSQLLRWWSMQSTSCSRRSSAWAAASPSRAKTCCAPSGSTWTATALTATPNTAPRCASQNWATTRASSARR